jgi:hypothetical protein
MTGLYTPVPILEIAGTPTALPELFNARFRAVNAQLQLIQESLTPAGNAEELEGSDLSIATPATVFRLLKSIGLGDGLTFPAAGSDLNNLPAGRIYYADDGGTVLPRDGTGVLLVLGGRDEFCLQIYIPVPLLGYQGPSDLSGANFELWGRTRVKNISSAWSDWGCLVDNAAMEQSTTEKIANSVPALVGSALSVAFPYPTNPTGADDRRAMREASGQYDLTVDVDPEGNITSTDLPTGWTVVPTGKTGEWLVTRNRVAQKAYIYPVIKNGFGYVQFFEATTTSFTIVTGHHAASSQNFVATWSSFGVMVTI